MKSIGIGIFSGFKYLRQFVAPVSLKLISKNAFAGTPLEFANVADCVVIFRMFPFVKTV